MSIHEYISKYNGFTITDPIGNNAFSYEDRSCQDITIPAFIEGSLADVEYADHIVFAEVEDGVERQCRGLKNLIYWSYNNKHIFIIDNHNHAFYCWFIAWKMGWFSEGIELIHVDQHKDMRDPEIYLNDNLDQWTADDVFMYTNNILNVGNFIQPALKAGLISKNNIIMNDQDFEKNLPGEFILDLDLDIFAPELDYIPVEKKINYINRCIERSNIITIATSPFFLEEALAKKYLNLLFP